MQFLAAYIMKGRIQAITVAAALALLSLAFPPASIVSSASVALVTLRLGWREGLFVMTLASIAVTLLGTVLLGSYLIAIAYGVLLLLLWAPVWGVAILLREGRRLILAMEAAVMLGAASVLAVYLFHPEPAQIWREFFAVLEQIMQHMQPDFSLKMDKDALEVKVHRMTGEVAAGVVAGLLSGLLLGRWWQALLYNPGGFGAEFLALRGHASLAVATVVILAVSLLMSGTLAEIFQNVLWVLRVLYVFIGIAVFHSVLSRIQGRGYVMPLFYVAALMVLPFQSLVAICGLVDNWLNLRKKISNSTAG